ncbi:unnamed protein product [Durusdinium trenchii]|uniref:Hexosyltransferase n=1 Tax=Durusdinium trenchii TaxID=1381693 RepID=A0ABP0LVG3_9DINO
MAMVQAYQPLFEMALDFVFSPEMTLTLFIVLMTYDLRRRRIMWLPSAGHTRFAGSAWRRMTGRANVGAAPLAGRARLRRFAPAPVAAVCRFACAVADPGGFAPSVLFFMCEDDAQLKRTFAGALSLGFQSQSRFFVSPLVRAARVAADGGTSAWRRFPRYDALAIVPGQALAELRSCRPQVLYLGYTQAAPWRRRIGPSVREAEYLWTTVAYVLWPSGARRLLEELPVDQPVDNFMSQLMARKKLRGFATVPPLAAGAGGFGCSFGGGLLEGWVEKRAEVDLEDERGFILDFWLH